MKTKFFRVWDLASSPDRAGRYPVSVNTLWRWAREGNFPRPIKLAPGVTVWKAEDVEAWEQRTAGEAAGVGKTD